MNDNDNERIFALKMELFVICLLMFGIMDVFLCKRISTPKMLTTISLAWRWRKHYQIHMDIMDLFNDPGDKVIVRTMRKRLGLLLSDLASCHDRFHT